MRYLLPLILFTLPFLAIAEEEIELPRAAQTAVKRFTDAEAKLKAEFNKDMNKLYETLGKALEKEKTKATKAGKLEVAMAIKAEIETRIPKKDMLGKDLGKKTPKLVIISAKYGAKTTFVDVSEKITKMIQKDTLKMTPADLGIDPVPNVRKYLVIEYKLGNAKFKKTVYEGNELNIK